MCWTHICSALPLPFPLLISFIWTCGLIPVFWRTAGESFRCVVMITVMTLWRWLACSANSLEKIQNSVWSVSNLRNERDYLFVYLLFFLSTHLFIHLLICLLLFLGLELGKDAKVQEKKWQEGVNVAKLQFRRLLRKSNNCVCNSNSLSRSLRVEGVSTVTISVGSKFETHIARKQKLCRTLFLLEEISAGWTNAHVHYGWGKVKYFQQRDFRKDEYSFTTRISQNS